MKTFFKDILSWVGQDGLRDLGSIGLDDMENLFGYEVWR